MQESKCYCTQLADRECTEDNCCLNYLNEAIDKSIKHYYEVKKINDEFRKIDKHYEAIFTEQKEGGYLVRFADFPEAITQGETLEQAKKEAQDCLAEAIANRIALKQSLP